MEHSEKGDEGKKGQSSVGNGIRWGEKKKYVEN